MHNSAVSKVSNFLNGAMSAPPVLKSGLLTVKGAKYNRRIPDESRDKVQDKVQAPFFKSEGILPIQSTIQQSLQSSSRASMPLLGGSNSTTKIPSRYDAADEKYWKQPGTNGDDKVVIHVCDENQQISKDFCCKRDILINHMKYFEKFLADNENGYDDIDISVHCDVEIFEWLMAYIHEPDKPPVIDKSIIVSILISSEFLQMDSLVELCIQHVAFNLNEIIKLPIDLSCISEKLVNRVAALASPKVLSETKDRKDKILTKLYKRRVELDFSRKGSTSRGLHNPGSNLRTIAASLTCCRYCGMVYLDNYVTFLSCRSSQPTIDFRGNLASRHCAIPGWSLTSYLKTLHSGGMGWDAIYWHVWAACIVFRVENMMISALEVDRYTIESDGLLIRPSPAKDADNEATATDGSAAVTAPSPHATKAVSFSLGIEDDSRLPFQQQALKLLISHNRYDSYGSGSNDLGPSYGPQPITSTLNPLRPAEILTQEIYDLICSQMKFIVALNHKQLLQSTMKSIVDNMKIAQNSHLTDFYDLLYGDEDKKDDEPGERRRGRSPGRNARGNTVEPRKQAHSLSLTKTRRSSIQQSAATSAPAAKDKETTDSQDSAQDDSDAEGPPPGPTITTTTIAKERRSRSLGNRRSSSVPVQKAAGGIAIGGGVSAKVSRRAAGGESKYAFLHNQFNGLSLLGNQAPSDSVGMGGDVENVVDAAMAKNLSILKSIPPEVHHKLVQGHGMLYGVWLVPHILQLQSAAHEEMLALAAESHLSEHRKLEWELDIIREFDEKRMLTYEKFLLSKRNAALATGNLLGSVEATIAARGRGNFPVIGGSTSKNTLTAAGAGAAPRNPQFKAGEYYKDKGRQPH